MLVSVSKVRNYIGLMLKCGVRNLEVLLPAFEFLSRHGCANSSLVLGEYYRTGNLLDFDGSEFLKRRQLICPRRYRTPNAKKAELYLKKACRQGCGVAQYYLMALYVSLLECEKACYCGKRALPHLTREMRGCCYHALGYLYYNFNTAKDAKGIAVDYWRKAARCGNGTAVYELGVLYMFGENVRCNLKRARKYFEKCILLNNFCVSNAKRKLKKLRQQVSWQQEGQAARGSEINDTV